jgi:Uma2 family endonuclease
MSVLATPAKPLERILSDPYWLRQFSVAEYHKMVETGILTTNDRVELLEGWIVNKMPQNPPHISSVGRANRWLVRILPVCWSLRCQGPITLTDSEPEPDIAVARGEEGTYDSRHPEPADIGVLMEVGDSTLLADRQYKGELYAKEKVREFWLINLVERKIEVYTKPRGGKYHKKVEYVDNDSVPLVLDGVHIADIPVRELMPKS